MEEVKLFADNGAFVATAFINYTPTAPQVVTWNGRVFVQNNRDHYKEVVAREVVKVKEEHHVGI